MFLHISSVAEYIKNNKFLISGTNDKAGGPIYVLRWGNPQAIKETFVPQTDITYPYMSD